MTWNTSISQSSQSARINNIRQYVIQDVNQFVSPIDTFYSFSQELLRVGDVDFLTNNPHIGGLLLVGLVSCAENYFRDILSNVISLCPISQAESADESIMLGSVIWHEPSNALRGAFEHFSFASSANLLKACQKFTGLRLNNSTAILSEFDKVCELRHGIVHAGACIPGKNAVKLQLPSFNGILRIRVGFPELQEAGFICTNLVTSINQELFESLVKRWAEDWRRLASWNSGEEVLLFQKIWNLFYSENDSQRGLIPTPLNMQQCMASVQQHYGLS